MLSSAKEIPIVRILIFISFSTVFFARMKELNDFFDAEHLTKFFMPAY